MDGMMMRKRKVPSLVDLCVQTAIDNLRYVGNVGGVDSHLLERILPHCNIDQLTHIENSTEGRDLSSVTDNLWKRFYEKQFGKENYEKVIRDMKQRKAMFKWRKLYDAKTREREAFQDKLGEKLKQRYKEEQDKKQSRQVKFTAKAPPSSNKRHWSSGSSCNVSNLKSNIMKKAKIECLKSHETRIHATIRKNALQQKNFPPPSISCPTKPRDFLRTGSTSSSKLPKPPPGRG